jgi:hypothetical protein
MFLSMQYVIIYNLKFWARIQNESLNSIFRNKKGGREGWGQEGRAGLDGVEKGKISCPCHEWNWFLSYPAHSMSLYWLSCVFTCKNKNSLNCTSWRNITGKCTLVIIKMFHLCFTSVMEQEAACCKSGGYALDGMGILPLTTLEWYTFTMYCYFYYWFFQNQSILWKHCIWNTISILLIYINFYSRPSSFRSIIRRICNIFFRP